MSSHRSQNLQFQPCRSPHHILNFKILTLTEKVFLLILFLNQKKKTLQKYHLQYPWLDRPFNYIAAFVLIGYQWYIPSKEIPMVVHSLTIALWTNFFISPLATKSADIYSWTGLFVEASIIYKLIFPFFFMYSFSYLLVQNITRLSLFFTM